MVTSQATARYCLPPKLSVGGLRFKTLIFLGWQTLQPLGHQLSDYEGNAPVYQHSDIPQFCRAMSRSSAYRSQESLLQCYELIRFYPFWLNDVRFIISWTIDMVQKEKTPQFSVHIGTFDLT